MELNFVLRWHLRASVYSPQNIFNAKILNPHKKPISLLYPGYAANLVARGRYYHCHWTLLLLPAWRSSNMTFTNETDDNPAEAKLKSQDWVDNGTRDNLFRWIYGSSEDEKLNYHNLPIIYLYVCRNNHTNYIFHHSICVYICIFIIIMNYRD